MLNLGASLTFNTAVKYIWICWHWSATVSDVGKPPKNVAICWQKWRCSNCRLWLPHELIFILFMYLCIYLIYFSSLREFSTATLKNLWLGASSSIHVLTMMTLFEQAEAYGNNEWGESSAFSYRPYGWVWEVTVWSSRHQENYQSF